MAGLIDHAHPTAADLFQQFIVAEVTNHAQRQRRRLAVLHAGDAFGRRIEHLIDRFDVCEIGPQFAGQFRMLRDELFLIDRFTTVDPHDVLGQHFIERRVVVRQIRLRHAQFPVERRCSTSRR